MSGVRAIDDDGEVRAIHWIRPSRLFQLRAMGLDPAINRRTIALSEFTSAGPPMTKKNAQG
jgi:hypothetical protein